MTMLQQLPKCIRIYAQFTCFYEKEHFVEKCVIDDDNINIIFNETTEKAERLPWEIASYSK